MKKLFIRGLLSALSISVIGCITINVYPNGDARSSHISDTSACTRMITGSVHSPVVHDSVGTYDTIVRVQPYTRPRVFHGK